jgi:peroxiredoxin
MIAQKLTITHVMSINKRYRIALTGLACFVSILTVWSQSLDTPEKTIIKKTTEAQTLPIFRFFTVADSVLFTSAQLDPNKPILLFYFSTKCPYCQDLTKEITQSIDSLRDIQILMVSGHRRQSLTKYADMFSLKNFPITLLKDDEKRMHEYFDYSAVPMLRLYDKNRQLIYRQEGKLSVKEILTLFRQHI